MTGVIESSYKDKAVEKMHQYLSGETVPPIRPDWREGCASSVIARALACRSTQNSGPPLPRPRRRNVVLGGALMEVFMGSIMEAINGNLNYVRPEHFNGQARNQIIDHIAQVRATTVAAGQPHRAPLVPPPTCRPPSAQVAKLHLCLLDIKPGNILVKHYHDSTFKHYPGQGSEWDAARWGTQLDIRLADFDACALAACRRRPSPPPYCIARVHGCRRARPFPPWPIPAPRGGQSTRRTCPTWTRRASS